MKFYKTLFTALSLAVAIAGCGGGGGADSVPITSATPTPNPSAPTVSSTNPGDTTVDVATNRQNVATFNEPMDPSTINDQTFIVMQGSTLIPGTVSYAGLTATFNPTDGFAPSTTYTATLTTGVKDLAGNALTTAYSWSFITGATADTIAPLVSSADPADAASGVTLNRNVTVNFSEAMDPATITDSGFTLMQGATLIPAAVTAVGSVATLDPSEDLLPSTTYTATIMTGAMDLAGNALAGSFVWSFTTGSTVAAGPAPVSLGTAGNFVILAKSGVSTTGTTSVVGDIGLSPAAASFITGFALSADATNVFSTSSLVTGKLYAANYAVPTPANMTTAVSDMETAFTDAAGRTLPDFTELGAGNISGLTLVPGLYKWGTGVLITGVGVTLSGGADDVWIFQIAQDLTVDNSAIITLSGGAQAKNIFWQVTGEATLGTAADFKGIILSKTLISLNTGAVMHGRALAQTAVTLDANAVTAP